LNPSLVVLSRFRVLDLSGLKADNLRAAEGAPMSYPQLFDRVAAGKPVRAGIIGTGQYATAVGCENDYSRQILTTKGLIPNARGTAALIYRPYHLCGVERHRSRPPNAAQARRSPVWRSPSHRPTLSPKPHYRLSRERPTRKPSPPIRGESKARIRPF
jgi:hypothetical protein